MKLVELWGSDVHGVIVHASTGINYTNQCGGTYCYHPTLEGAYVPLNFDPEPFRGLLDVWSNSGQEYADLGLQALLDKAGLGRVLEPLPYPALWQDAKELWSSGWGEAWIPVHVKEQPKNGSHRYTELLRALAGHYAVITYPNSD